jgi:S1-C subfamily serine protease
MVQSEENIFKPVRGVRHSDSLLPGEKVYSVGYPLIFDLAIAEGLIASVKKKGARSVFLSTAVTGKGSSGGALFDRYGYLVGITTAVITQADHYSLAIPASDYFGP